jgi:hypothetical protein
MQKLLLRLLLIISIVPSCKKEEIKCERNCVPVRVSGRAYDATTNNGFSNIPITASWSASFTMGGFAPSPKLVYKGKTDKDGYFAFVVNVDSSLFDKNHLDVQVPVQPEYLRNSYDHVEESLFEYSEAGLQNIDFAMYPKANLTIRLHRVQNDDFEYFSVEHYYKRSAMHYSDYLITGPQFARDTVIQTETSAGIHTKVKSDKTFGLGNVEERIDSIFCTAGGNNIIDIDY